MMIRKFIKYYKPHLKLFSLDIFSALFLSLLGLLYPLITRQIINVYVPSKNISMLIAFSAILLVIYGIRMVLRYIVDCYGHIVGVRIQYDMRNELFSHLQKLPFSFFDEHKTGALMSRITNDLFEISEMAHHASEDIIISVFMFIGSFVLLCTINVPLTLIIFAFLPILILFAVKKRSKMEQSFAKTRVQTAEINADIENSISGIRVTKTFTNRLFEEEKFKKENKKYVDFRSAAYKIMAEFTSGYQFILDLLNLVVVLVAGIFLIKGSINFGDFTAYILYIALFVEPLKRIVTLVEQYQAGMTGFRRFIEIMEQPSETDDASAIEISDAKGKIEFCDVSFNYDENSKVLSHINLLIESGKKIALVGPSGGGKTTLCHLIPRFYEINSGKITLDGTDIRNITRESLRKNIAIVLQDVFLFTGTIYDNIVYGKPDASKDDVIKAAKQANIHEFILSLADGYETYIGERGVKLSGGQKQRLAIARAFLKNPPILILDEATSALDNQTELEIQKSIDELCVGRTAIIVAHRLSTIKNADEIVVMSSDGIAESGKHQELMNKKGIYYELYNSQFKE